VAADADLLGAAVIRAFSRSARRTRCARRHLRRRGARRLDAAAIPRYGARTFRTVGWSSTGVPWVGAEFAFTLGYVLLDGIQYALGGLLCLLLLRLLLRKTWLAAACWMPLSVLLVAGTSPSGADLAAGALAGVLAMTMIFRIGLLANVVMLVTERLFTRLPLTLDPNAWYVGSSLLVLVVILAAATCGFRVALAGRSAFGSAAS